jgi:ferredoxin-NADP reductase
VTKTVTITGIDHTARLVMFKTAEGQEETVQAGPAVTRFNELKVGDTVTFKYSESLVFQLKKPGTPAAPGTETLGLGGGGGKTPGGALAQQLKTTVTVVSVDLVASTITVKTEDGRVVTRKVQEKKNLEGVKAGDQIEITYTQALLASVDPPK